MKKDAVNETETVIITEEDKAPEKEAEEVIITDKKEEKEKRENLFLKKILTYLILFLILGGVVTSLSAILPKLPYTLTKEEQLKEISFGFPLPFVEQKRTEEEIAPLIAADFNKSFILPRYDLYESRFNPIIILADIVINGFWIGLIGMFIIFLPKLSKKTFKYILIAFLLTLFIAIMPTPPGTFTIDTLEPMHFGFPLSFLEQTPDTTSIYMQENLDTILKQTFLAPKFLGSGTEGYKTHIVAYKLILSVLINAFILGAVTNLFRVIKLASKGKKKAVSDYYRDRWVSLVLKPLDKKNILPETASLKLKSNIKLLSSTKSKALNEKKK